MLAAARTFCAVVEQQDLVEPRAAAEQILLALTDVVAAAVRLPSVEYTEDHSAAEVTTAQWQVTYRRIGQLLGPYSGQYWEITYPFAEDERAARPSLGDVVDDVADVWRDLTDGLLRLDAGALIG